MQSTIPDVKKLAYGPWLGGVDHVLSYQLLSFEPPQSMVDSEGSASSSNLAIQAVTGLVPGELLEVHSSTSVSADNTPMPRGGTDQAALLTPMRRLPSAAVSPSLTKITTPKSQRF